MKTDDYIIALEKFIDGLDNMSDTMSENVSVILSDLCDVLRIGRISAVFYANPISENAGIGKMVVFYDFGRYDESVCISCRKISTNENTIVYSVWRREDVQEWSEVESKRILRLIELLYVFNGRTHFSKIAEKLIYSDNDFDIHNFRYYLRYIRQLILNEHIAEFTAVFLNLKKFSVINQQIGRANGTVVMGKFVKHIKDCMEPDELICRVGGDNFTMLVKHENIDKFLDIIAGTSVTLDTPGSERIVISATAGVYVIKENDNIKLPTEVMDRITFASQLARSDKKVDVMYYNQELMELNTKNNLISAIFPSAIENSEFLVYYQPKVSLGGYKLVGAEALCRWNRDGKLISPADFIPVLEQGMDICRLDFYMLDKVCSHIRKWLDSGKKAVRVSVNISRRHLSDLDLSRHILNIIDRYQVPHELIEIELTETTSGHELKNLKRVITEFQKNGLTVSVDDFGIGYSSLNLIKDIPWNVLKLDKSLLPDDSTKDTPQKVLFKYVIAMAQAMGLECIAEGVETREQVELLRDNACNVAQGYFFDKPLPLEEFEARLENYSYSIG